MQIQGPAHVHGAQPVNAPHANNRPTPPSASGPASSADEVTISQEANMLARISETPEARQARVDQIRAQIAEGRYDTNEKLDVAVDRLLDEMV